MHISAGWTLDSILRHIRSTRTEDQGRTGAFPKETAPDRSPVAPWKLLLADDDEEVHSVTTLVLRDLTFDKREVAFLHARSGAEAQGLFEQHADIAVALIDVAMETEDSGLAVVRHVREALRNPWTRLILRTGHPGAAPEREVVLRYDINDYRAKSELSSMRLVTAVVAGLRGYRDIMLLEQARRATLEMASIVSSMGRTVRLAEFADTALSGLMKILDVPPHFSPHRCSGGLFVELSERTASGGSCLAARGCCEKFLGKSLTNLDPWMTRQIHLVKALVVNQGFIALRIPKGQIHVTQRATGIGFLPDSYVLIVYLERALTPHELSIIEFFRLKAAEALNWLQASETKSDALQRVYQTFTTGAAIGDTPELGDTGPRGRVA